MEPFAISRIADRCAWLAGVCVGFPTFLVLLLIASLAHEFGSGRPPQWSMALMGGDSNGLRLAVGDVGARHIPPGWHGPSRIGTPCLLLVARAAPRTA